MKISKSKRQLAQLLIEAGVTQLPGGVNWAAQDKGDCCVWGYVEKPYARSGGWHKKTMSATPLAYPLRLVNNWHQTVLSRDELDQIVAEYAPDTDGRVEFDGAERPSGYFNKIVDVKLHNGRVLTDSSGRFDWDTDGPSRIIAYRLHKPELAKSTAVGGDETNLSVKGELEALESAESPEQRAKLARIYAPTLDQLLQDWRNADDYAKRKQTEADEAAAMRDERWQAVQARAGELGVTVGRHDGVIEPEMAKPVTTGKFRNAKLGSPEHYISNTGWYDEVCDECGKRFGNHYDTRCNP